MGECVHRVIDKNEGREMRERVHKGIGKEQGKGGSTSSQGIEEQGKG
jgi:hypothetical protein